MGVDRLPSGGYRARLMIEGRTYTATFATEAEAGEWVVVTRGRVVGERAARRLTTRNSLRCSEDMRLRIRRPGVRIPPSALPNSRQKAPFGAFWRFRRQRPPRRPIHL